MGQFYQILRARNLVKHNGQSLWKYNLNDSEFFHLQKSLTEAKSLYNIDPRDCTLFYAEWWKRNYNGGYPSKNDIYNVISNDQYFDAEEFYRHAKKGAQLLGIKWIKNQNTLYFKTLLLQGGLPVQHIANNSGAYKNFLLKILELNPSSIDDFAFEIDIISLLPNSSRNDSIYECCLQIVRAIINDDEQFLAILNGNEELQAIGSALRIKKHSLQVEYRKSKVKTAWVLEPEKSKIRLYLGFPDNVDTELFKELFFGEEEISQTDFEYKFYVDEHLLCKFVKKANGNFKTFWINQKDLIWNGNIHLPEMYLVSNNGIKNNCNQLVTFLPNKDKPGLWVKYSDKEWILEKGTHTNQTEGYILSPKTFAYNIAKSAKEVTLFNETFNWLCFEDVVELNKNGECYKFKTDSKKIEWFVQENKPLWMKKANLPVVRRNPKILVYDQNGSLVKNVKFQWRPKSNLVWNDWNCATIPVGLLEVKINAEDTVEIDEFFNVGNLNLKKGSKDLSQAELELTNNQFIFRVNEDAFVSVESIDENKFRLNLKNNNTLPDSIHASIRCSNQSKSLRFEIQPPFKGVEILDNENRLTPDEACFTVNNLFGYRLISNAGDLVTNIYNNKRPNIIISNSLTESYIPLREYEDKLLQLAMLSDAMDNDAEIILEICEVRGDVQTKLKEYKFKKYSHSISYAIAENRQFTITIDADLKPDLFAVPLDVEVKDMMLYDLVNQNGTYRFREAVCFEKFIVFASNDAQANIQPAVISLNRNNKRTSPQDKLDRIDRLKNQLLESQYSDEVWEKLLSYYKICYQNNLPFSAFDILRTACFSSALAAKIYVFLLCFDVNQNFSEDIYKHLEDDLGFSFHWINKEDWRKAMEWIGCFENPVLFKQTSAGILSHFNTLQPSHQFQKISNHILQNRKPTANPNFHLNTRINSLRSSLGARVLNELPKKCPEIPLQYDHLLPGHFNNIDILLKSPLAVALSIAGKDESL